MSNALTPSLDEEIREDRAKPLPIINSKQEDTPHQRFRKDLVTVLTEIQKFLIAKNVKYGDSALTPINCFSKLSPLEGINIRLDDKVKRLLTGDASENEDVELDLVGYIVIKRIFMLRMQREGKTTKKLSQYSEEEIGRLSSSELAALIKEGR